MNFLYLDSKKIQLIDMQTYCLILNEYLQNLFEIYFPKTVELV